MGVNAKSGGVKPHQAVHILAQTLWGEARGEGALGMECVANVILNRVCSGVKWWGTDVVSVCLAPWQFSCWNKNDPNRAKLLKADVSLPSFSLALEVAGRALQGLLEDKTGGADSYHTTALTPPKWALGLVPTATIGHHVFYKTIKGA